MKHQILRISEFYLIRTTTIRFHFFDIECIDAYRSEEFLSRNGKSHRSLFWLAAPNGIVPIKDLERFLDNKINKKFKNI